MILMRSILHTVVDDNVLFSFLLVYDIKFNLITVKQFDYILVYEYQ